MVLLKIGKLFKVIPVSFYLKVNCHISNRDMSVPLALNLDTSQEHIVLYTPVVSTCSVCDIVLCEALRV